PAARPRHRSLRHRPPPPHDDSPLEDARVYAFGFENHVRAVRLVSRARLLRAQDTLLAGLDPEAREEALTRWRAYAIREGHLRHRFILQSARYPGPGPREAIAEIRSILESEEASDRHTGEITALLRRLFGGDNLREVLADPALYVECVALLKDLANRWNTPGS